MKLPTTLKLTWHDGKTRPTDVNMAHVIHAKLRGKEPVFTFAQFIPETLNGHDFSRWRTIDGEDVFVAENFSKPAKVLSWAEIKAETK